MKRTHVFGWLLSTLLLLCGACQPDSSTLVILVDGLTPDMKFLRVSAAVDGQPARTEEYTAAPMIGLRLPVDRRGAVTLTVSGVGEERCVTAQGRATASATGAERVDVPVTLVTLPARLCTLSVVTTGEGAGAVSADPQVLACGASCAAELPVGTAVTLSARPEDGSYFAGWSGACSGSGPCVLRFSGPTQLTASFGVNLLTVSRSGAGTGTVRSDPAGISCGDQCEGRFRFGQRVVLTAAPGPGSYFAGWSGACQGTFACQPDINGPQQVVAVFGKNTLTVTRQGSGSGSVTSAPLGISCGTQCGYDFTAGTQVVLTARPDVGHYFVGWSGACQGTGSCALTLDRPAQVAATFSKNTFQVVKTGGGGGTVTSVPAGISCGTLCSYDFPVGTALQLAARADAGSYFTGFSGACTGQICNLSLTGPAQVTANFVPMYTVAVGRAGTGTGSVTSDPAGISCGATCSMSVPSGTRLTLSARPDLSSNFAGWSGACSGSGPCTVTVMGPISVTAKFLTKQCSASRLCWENPLPNGNLPTAVWGSSASDVWMVGRSGSIQHYNGSAWSSVSSGTTNHLTAVWGSSAADVWAVGDSGTVLHNTGGSWTAAGPATGDYYRGVWGSGRNDVWLVGYGIYHYDGASWTSLPNPAGTWLTGVWGSSASDVWIVSYGGTLLHNTGAGFTRVAAPNSNYYVGVFGFSASDVWVISDYGKHIHYNGSVWSESTNTNRSARAVWGSSAGEVWVAASGAMQRFSGGAWTDVSTGTSGYLTSVWGSGASSAWAVGPGGVVRYDGAAWTDTGLFGGTAAPYLKQVWGSGAGDVWAVGNGWAMRYDGSAWTQLPYNGMAVWGSGANDVWLAGYGSMTRWDGSGYSTYNLGSVYLTSVWGSGPSDIFGVGYATTDGSGVIMHWDGTRWSSMAAGTANRLAAVWGFGPRDVWVAGSQGTLLRYNGVSWIPVSTGSTASLSGLWGTSASDLYVVGGQLLRWNGAGLSVVAGVSGYIATVYGSSAGNIWAVGTSGAVWRYDGSAWRQLDSGTKNSLFGVWSTGPGHGYVVGEYGTILRYQP